MFGLELEAPFRLDLTAWALRRRAHNAIDRLDAGVYRRALAVGDGTLALAVTQPAPARLAVELRGGPADGPGEAAARAALDRLLGLSADLSAFAALAACDPLLDRLARRMRGVRPPRFASVFEALVNAVACQQLSLTVGIHLLNRLTVAYGRSAGGAPDGLRAFPDPQSLASRAPAELRPLGFSLAKARTIVEASRLIADGALDVEALERLDDHEAVLELTRLRGVGRWSAEYVLLRGLGRLHVFPGDDVGARNKLSQVLGVEAALDYAAVGQLVARWQPYAGLVYFHLLLDSLAADGVIAP